MAKKHNMEQEINAIQATLTDTVKKKPLIHCSQDCSLVQLLWRIV